MDELKTDTAEALPAAARGSAPYEEDEHPMDKHFGHIHALAIGLVRAGHSADALALGEAHEALQGHVIGLEQRLEDAREALAGMLPLAQKLFNNTVAAAKEKGLALQPAWVTFDDLKFVQKSRAVLASIPDSSQGSLASETPQAEKD